MALTPPTIDRFEVYKNETFDPSEYESIEEHLQAATDLMELATGIHTDFELGTLEYRTMERGILDAAWYIGTSLEDRDAMFSPFSSERIGSYSYNKMAGAAAMKVDSGIPFFDLAVKYFSGLDVGGSIMAVSSEAVMPPLEWYRDQNCYWVGSVD